MSLTLMSLSHPRSADIGGKVVDADGQTPIVGALVSVQASDLEVLTDEQGAFTLSDVGDQEVVIVGAKQGYFNGAGVTATDPASDLLIELTAVPQDDNPRL